MSRVRLQSALQYVSVFAFIMYAPPISIPNKVCIVGICELIQAGSHMISTGSPISMGTSGGSISIRLEDPVLLEHSLLPENSLALDFEAFDDAPPAPVFRDGGEAREKVDQVEFVVPGLTVKDLLAAIPYVGRCLDCARDALLTTRQAALPKTLGAAVVDVHVSGAPAQQRNH